MEKSEKIYQKSNVENCEIGLEGFFMRSFLVFFFFGCVVSASEIPNFRDLSLSRGVVVLLTTPRSGTNFFSSCLSILTRRPISWLEWGDAIFHPNSDLTKQLSYNRLNLPLVDQRPILYRTHHGYRELGQISPLCNRLIFLTRNPKELLFRAYFLAYPGQKEPDFHFIQNFLDEYLIPLKLYESWNPANRMLIFYEDLIVDADRIVLDALDFMGIAPAYLEDFVENNETYKKRLLESYTKQQVNNRGGSSSIGGTKAIYYSKDIDPEILKKIDLYLMQREPNLWKLYLNRFES